MPSYHTVIATHRLLTDRAEFYNNAWSPLVCTVGKALFTRLLDARAPWLHLQVGMSNHPKCKFHPRGLKLHRVKRAGMASAFISYTLEKGKSPGKGLAALCTAFA